LFCEQEAVNKAVSSSAAVIFFMLCGLKKSLQI
jgi:hypothetical protein